GLDVQVSCHAEAILNASACGPSSRGGDRMMAFWFARARESGCCYWCALDPTDPATQSQWALIPGFDKVVKLIGAIPFRAVDGTNHILLFAKTHTEGIDKLIMTRYKLNPSPTNWDDKPIPLDGPPDVRRFNAVVNQQRILAQYFVNGEPPGRHTARVV